MSTPRAAQHPWFVVTLIAGPDGVDPGCSEMELGDPERVNMADLRVFVVEGDGRKPEVAAVLRRAQQQAAYALARAARRAAT